MSKLKVGLYLQDLTIKGNMEVNFAEAMDAVQRSDIDLLVFPENYYYPFAKEIESTNILDKNSLNDLVEKTLLPFSRKINCAVIFCGTDKSTGEDTFIFSIFVNPYFNEQSPKYKLYIKHTACNKSAFEIRDYSIEDIFRPIPYKGFKIGHTICYDSNFSMFSRAYAVHGANLIINSTGGNVDYKKWARYQKTRAIENTCFSLCTMAQNDKSKKNKSYIYAYDRQGNKMKQTILYKSRFSLDEKIMTVLLDDQVDSKVAFPDKDLMQEDSVSSNQDFELSRTYLISVLNNENFQYVQLPIANQEVLLIKVRDNFILSPEILHALLMKKGDKMKVLIVNQWSILDKVEFEARISIVAKTRCVELMCPVLVISPDIFSCYQPGMNKTVQSVKKVNDAFGIDLNRANGFDSIKAISGKALSKKMYHSLICHVAHATLGKGK